MRRLLLPVALVGALLAGCDVVEGLLPSAGEVESPSAASTATPGALPTATPAPAALEEVPEEPGEVVLTVWTSEALAPSSETPGGQTLLEQLAAFDEAYPDIRVKVEVKLARGAGSTLAYLRSAPPVAPGILPDIALLDREGLVQAAREELIVPVEPLLDPAIRADLYPVAEQLGTVDGVLVGLPYALEVQHAVYREAVFEEPPVSYEAVLSSLVPYEFPAGTLGVVNHTTLLQYLAAGGTLLDEEGAPLLDADALRNLLIFYDEAHDARVIDAALFQMTDPAEAWERYLNRQANYVTATSTLYLSKREELRGTGVVWIPTQDGQPYALASGLSWVVVTRDPARQEAAMRLVNLLMDPANQGEYAKVVYRLPSQRAALAVWGDSDPYASFADTLLNNADPLPDTADRSVVGEAIQDAFESVLLSDVLPIQAVNQAIQAVNPTEPEGQ